MVDGIITANPRATTFVRLAGVDVCSLFISEEVSIEANFKKLDISFSFIGYELIIENW
jgi:hypothetical protein